ncbi:MAG: hypothetical protein AAF384_17910 [Pseudomonadota bacterium]
MKMKMRTLFSSLVLWGLFAPALDAAEDAHGKALRGVAGYFVEVEGVHPDFARYGLTTQDLRERVTQTLIRSGVSTLTREEIADDAQGGRLLLSLRTNRETMTFYFYGLALRAEREIPIGDGGLNQTVWSDTEIGVAKPFELKRVLKLAESLTEKLIEAHQRANRPVVVGALQP